MSPRAVILIGAPGAGKGTMAEAIRTATPYAHVSTGDMLREAVKTGAPIGREAAPFMQRGELVPDAVIMRLIAARLEGGAPDSRYLFDGFPRTLPQAASLDAVFAQRGARLDGVFLLETPTAVVLQRLTGRRVCRACGAVYHLTNIPPRTPGRCDQCGGELYQRDDDREATILNRLDVFQRQTADVIAYYERRGLLARFDASAPREATIAALLAQLRRYLETPA